MKVTVKYLGNVAEQLKSKYEYIELPEATTYLQFLEVLNTLHPDLQGFVYKVAINQSIATEDVELKDDDEIAILPPYSGG